MNIFYSALVALALTLAGFTAGLVVEGAVTHSDHATWMGQ